ncbi:MAG: hypothetical protein JSS96_07835, partial [Bacteroidetes bacterium]|nr:hypothetical protein [Bacteroidota bacterium]
AYWWSNYKNNPSGLGVDEELYYRREHKHWSLELSLGYSTYHRSLNYYKSYSHLDSSNFSAYDKETLHTYAFVLGIQYLLYGGNHIRSYVGAFTNPVYYYYKFHALPGSFSDMQNGGTVRLGGGISYTTEYRPNKHFGFNAILRRGYLQQRDLLSEDGLYSAPEFKTNLLIGCGYFF